MGNSISHISKNILHLFSNHFTGVLYSVLLISGSELAKSEWEKLFMIRLAEHDQNHVGLGIVGIDFDDIPWSIKEFEKQRAFVIGIAKKAITDKSWEKLDYYYNWGNIEPCPIVFLTKLLNEWISIFSNAATEDIVEQKNNFSWYRMPSLSDLDKKCPVHKIYLNRLGNSDSDCCYLCHDN